MGKNILNLMDLREYLKRDCTMTLEATGKQTSTGEDMSLVIGYDGTNLVLEIFKTNSYKEELKLSPERYDLQAHTYCSDRVLVTLKNKINSKVLLNEVQFKSSDYFTI